MVLNGAGVECRHVDDTGHVKAELFDGIFWKRKIRNRFRSGKRIVVSTTLAFEVYNDDANG